MICRHRQQTRRDKPKQQNMDNDDLSVIYPKIHFSRRNDGDASSASSLMIGTFLQLTHLSDLK